VLQLLEVSARLTGALKFLHSKGIVHVDVKPSNIFIDVEGIVWLGDYGSCQPLGSSLFGIGTPIYQTSDLAANATPQLDFACLATSIAEKAGFLPFPRKQHTLSELRAIFEGQPDNNLTESLLDLLKLCIPKSYPEPPNSEFQVQRPRKMNHVLKDLAIRMAARAARQASEAKVEEAEEKQGN
jgi:serine/threonine protein kinase